MDAKGKAEPVAVWEALEARAPPRRRRHAASRARRSSAAREELDLAPATRSPCSAASARRSSSRSSAFPASARAGSSPSSWPASTAEPELVFWRQGRSLPYGDGVTFWALGEMVKAQAGILESDGAETARREARRDGRRPRRRARRGRAGSRSTCDRSSASRVERAAAATGAARRSRPGAAFFEALAEQHPLVLVFEDLHWADDALLDFVDHLVDWASGVPLLVVCTARPELLERRPRLGRRQAERDTISLSPLDGRRDRAADRRRCSSGRCFRPRPRRRCSPRAGGQPALRRGVRAHAGRPRPPAPRRRPLATDRRPAAGARDGAGDHRRPPRRAAAATRRRSSRTRPWSGKVVWARSARRDRSR